MSSKPVTINPPGHPPIVPTYSHISTVPVNASSKLISFAGQVGYDPVSKSIPQGLPAQVTLALENLSKCLETVGAERADIVQVRHYVVGMSKLDQEDKEKRGKI